MDYTELFVPVAAKIWGKFTSEGMVVVKHPESYGVWHMSNYKDFLKESPRARK